jgi:hypothetical protein
MLFLDVEHRCSAIVPDCGAGHARNALAKCRPAF